MLHRRHLLVLGLLALSGCGGGEAARPEAATRPDGAARPQAAPRTAAFDGRWAGALMLNPDRTRDCPAAALQEREITVRRGLATLVLNPETRQTQTGFVTAEGSLRMADSLDRTIATTGQFVDGAFIGEYRNGMCSYAMRMTRRN